MGVSISPTGAALANRVSKGPERSLSRNRRPSPKSGFLKLAFVGSGQIM